MIDLLDSSTWTAAALLSSRWERLDGTSAIVAGVVQPETPEAEVLLVGRWLRVDELGPLGWSRVTP